MRGVQLNDGSGADGAPRDWKFADKYLVKNLPATFHSAKQFDALMSVPVGKDWNTIESFKRLIQNDVLTKAGSIIKPLRYKKDLNMETIEKLVAHRTSKKSVRSSAKF